MSGATSLHKALVEGFHGIVDKNGLGWSVLDSKSEQVVCFAIAAAINRNVGRRIAHVEFDKRIDLAILRAPIPHRPGRMLDKASCAIDMRYEAKIGQAFDFAPLQKTPPTYLGDALNEDMADMRRGTGAGLFFVSEARDANRHLKYFKGHVATIEIVTATLQKRVIRGELVTHETLDCGTCDGTNVKLHMFVFDPRSDASRAS